MNKIKQIIALVAVVVGLVFGANMAFAQTSSTDMPRQSLRITEAGKVSITGAKVVSVEGSNINAVISWGGTWSLPGIIKVESSTDFLRRGGGKGSMSEIAPGNYLNVEGKLDVSASSPTVIARSIRNWSVIKMEINPFGIVSSIDSTAKTFMFKTEARGDLKVLVSDSTVFSKENATVLFSSLKVGDMVTVKGLWEKNTNTLQAQNVKIRVQGRTVFQGGIIKTLPVSSTAPTSMVVTFGKTDYTVNISTDTGVLNSKWVKAKLSDFKLEDRIYVYGPADGTTIDATTVRNTSLR